MQNRRPYFLWDYDLTDEQVKAILAGHNQTDKIWLISRILESAKYEDVWYYLKLSQVKEIFPLLKLKPSIKLAWQRALNVWQ